MTESSSEELRALLKAAEFARGTTPMRPTRDINNNSSHTSSDVPLNELASLITSLDIDIGSPMRIVRNRNSMGAVLPVPPSRSHTDQNLTLPPDTTNHGQTPYTPGQKHGGTVPNTSTSMFRPPSAVIKPSSQLQPSQMGLSNDWDYTVIKFGSEISLRGRLGKYLTIIPFSQPNAVPVPIVASSTSKSVQIPSAPLTKAFLLGLDGQGIGEVQDCFVFVNAENRDDISPIRYGMTVSIKSPAAKERLLGVREGTKPGFWRNLIGAGEKWLVLQASTRGVEEIGSRGGYVRSGDRLMLQTSGADNFLSLYEGVQGTEARLVHKDRAGLGTEVWQLDQFAVPSLPSWLARPYLSGRYLVTPPVAKLPAPEIEARTFPGAGTSSSSSSSGSNNGRTGLPPAPPLSSLSPGAQHALLLRELLLALSGVEGHYVRVAASQSPVPSSSSSSSGGGFAAAASVMLRELNLVVESDTADRSAASQVALLLPICESAVQLREFVRVHSRYEFGLVSQALASAIKTMLREFDILVAQLEHLLTTNRLSLQKMVYLLQPTKITLRLLEKLVRRLRDCAGGRLVDGTLSLTPTLSYSYS